GGKNAGGRHVERRSANDMRFAFANFLRANQAKTFDAVLLAAALQGREVGFLMRIGGHHQLAAVAMRNTVFGAKFVEQAVAFDAVARLQRILRVVDTGVNHAAVAGAGGHAELGELLDEKDVLPASRNRVSDRAANHAAANDQNIGLVHETDRIKQ